MDDASQPLAVNDTGQYADLSRRPLSEGLVLVFVPSLAAILLSPAWVKPLSQLDVRII
jgi:hypothetical protein